MKAVPLIDRLFEAHLTVANLDESIAFYRDRLGLELAHVTLARRAAFFWIGSRGNAMLGLWEGGAGPQKTTTHVAFAAALEDVIAAPKTLRSAGVMALDFDGKPTDEPVVLAWMPAASVYFHDPDGHLLEYVAMLDDPPRPDEGVLTWHQWTPSANQLPAGREPGARSDHRAHGLAEQSMSDTVVRVLAISGSLRSASSNGALIDAASHLAPVGIEVSIYRELADIPPFNPDLDTETAPAAVLRLRASLRACDAILISSPEYAHGVPGVLKNALDWVVGSGELIDKPIAVINTSSRATHAYASLQETLTTMSARVVGEASMTIALDGTVWNASGIAQDPRVSASLTSALAALAGCPRAARTP